MTGRAGAFGRTMKLLLGMRLLFSESDGCFTDELGLCWSREEKSRYGPPFGYMAGEVGVTQWIFLERGDTHDFFFVRIVWLFGISQN
jgi:hypothetical protein